MYLSEDKFSFDKLSFVVFLCCMSPLFCPFFSFIKNCTQVALQPMEILYTMTLE